MKTVIDGAVITEKMIKEIKTYQECESWAVETCDNLIDYLLYYGEKPISPEDQLNQIKAVRSMQDFFRALSIDNNQNIKSND